MNLARQGTLTQVSEDGVPDLTESMHAIGHSEENITGNNVVRSFSGGFSIGSWEDSNSIAFSSLSSKAGVQNNDDIISTFSNYELQVLSILHKKYFYHLNCVMHIGVG
jgi:hypothetical protein